MVYNIINRADYDDELDGVITAFDRVKNQTDPFERTTRGMDAADALRTYMSHFVSDETGLNMITLAVVYKIVEEEF